MKALPVFLILVAGVLLSRCTKVPVTGRSQLRLVSNERIIPSSFEAYQEVKRTNKLAKSGEQLDMVRRVGSRIQKAVERYFAERGQSSYLNGYDWEYILIEDGQTVNAWCMPGGKVAFYTGILPICKDEAGVAVVMGHEIAHAIANHGRERVSQTMVAQTGLGIAAIALGGGGGASITNDMILQGAGAATNLGILKFSRRHESEADELGLYFMAMAGYDPREAPSFWERMSAASGGQAPKEFLSTHPSHDTRISDLNGNMAKALEYYNRSQKAVARPKKSIKLTPR